MSGTQWANRRIGACVATNGRMASCLSNSRRVFVAFHKQVHLSLRGFLYYEHNAKYLTMIIALTGVRDDTVNDLPMFIVGTQETLFTITCANPLAINGRAFVIQ